MKPASRKFRDKGFEFTKMQRLINKVGVAKASEYKPPGFSKPWRFFYKILLPGICLQSDDVLNLFKMG